MTRWRLLTAVLASLLALIALFDNNGQLRLQVDSSPASIGGSQPEIEHLVIAIIRSTGIVASDLELTVQFARATKRLPGVLAVRTLATIKQPRAQGSAIDISSLAKRLRQAPQDAKRLLNESMDDPLLGGRLISADGNALAILVDFEATDEKQTLGLTHQLRALATHSFSSRPDISWAMSGTSIVNDAVGRLLVYELSIILPLAMLICAVFLWLSFASFIVVVAGVSTVFSANLWTLAVAAALGWKLNLITMLAPALVTALTLAYVMHALIAIGDAGSLSKGLARVRLGLIVTALTTMIGFIAIMSNTLPAMREFAVLGAVGTLAAALATETVLPPILRLTREPVQLLPWLNSGLVNLGKFMARHTMPWGRWIIAAALLTLGLSLAAATRVEPGARYIRDLKPTHPERVAFEAINQQFGGINRFTITIDSGRNEGIFESGNLVSVDELTQWLRQQPEVGSAVSLTDYVKRLHQAFMQGDRTSYSLPADPAASRQLTMLFGTVEMDALTTPEHRIVQIVVTTPLVETKQLESLFKRLDNRLGSLPPGLTWRLNGHAIDLAATVNSITSGQVRSIALAIVAIFIVLSILFTSPRVAFRAMLPNVLPIAIFFGLLGITGTPLGASTALVACIVLGIAVDDTLHLLIRFQQMARSHGDERRAARESVCEVIRPITLTTISTCAGFLVLGLSAFQSQAAFGVLAAVTLALAWFCDLVLTPVISARTRVVSLWDLVRLKLGSNPQDRIPLMAGLTARQARQLALYSRIIYVKPGQLLLQQGESGSDLYVSLDGEYEVSVALPDGQRKILAKCDGGTVFGEGGFLESQRKADVRVTTAGRVMIFDPDSLANLHLQDEELAHMVRENLTLLKRQRELINALDGANA